MFMVIDYKKKKKNNVGFCKQVIAYKAYIVFNSLYAKIKKCFFGSYFICFAVQNVKSTGKN